MQNVGRETGLREHFGGDNGANPQIHLLKILPRNRFHTAFPAMMPHWVTSLPIATMTLNAHRADALLTDDQSFLIFSFG